MSVFSSIETLTKKEVQTTIDKWYTESDRIYECLTPENKKWEPILKLVIKMQYKTLLSYFKLPIPKDISNDEE